MSQRLGSSRPNTSVPQHDAVNRSAPQTSRTLPPINRSTLAETPRSATSHGPQSPLYASNTSPAAHTGAQGRPSGPSGMQSLLNPALRDDATNTNRRRSADQLDTPAGTAATFPKIAAPFPSQGQDKSTLPSITPPLGSAYPANPEFQNGHRILTPHTPSSLVSGPLSATTGFEAGKFDAKETPFMPSRDHMHHREAIPQSLPPLSVGLPSTELSHPQPHPTRPPSGYPAHGFPPQGSFKEERRVSGGALPPQLPASQSNSPSTSYSSYSRFSNTPPAPHATVATTQPSSFFSQGYGDPNSNSTTTHTKGSYGSLGSAAGQNTYQLMTLDTGHGPIQVPIDVQAASKVADEKRKRNATASHRFRQRRKEKERETSTNIAKLEHQIRDIAEEREFYRMERDYFRSVACNKPGQVYPLRPPSPRQIRMAQASGNGHWQDEHSDGRNTRRRTSSYTPAVGLHPPVNAGPPQLPRYGPMTAAAGEPMEQRNVGIPGNPTGGPPLPHGASEHSNYPRGWKA